MMHIVICYYFAIFFTFHELLFMILILVDNQKVSDILPGLYFTPVVFLYLYVCLHTCCGENDAYCNFCICFTFHELLCTTV